MKTTIAKWLQIETFPFVILDDNGNPIYQEFADGSWTRREFDSEGKELRYEDSTGYWSCKQFDRFGLLFYENSRGLKLGQTKAKVNRIPMDGC
jgi:hypothetical protein